MIDLYDTEIMAIGDVLGQLNATTHHPRNLEGFRKEVIERFGLAGFVVTCVVFESNESGVFLPEITVVGRVEKLPEFDHDRQRFEVQTDVAGISTPGAITPNGTIIEPSKSTAFGS